MRFYVYVLIDPENNNEPFYVGKGSYERTEGHFNEKLVGNCRLDGEQTESILEQEEVPPANKIAKIAQLAGQGFDHSRIARIVARNLDESSAFAIESCLISFVYGRRSRDNGGVLLNIVSGHHPERFRCVSNWEWINNFDLPMVAGQRFDNLLIDESRPWYVYVLRYPDTGRIFYVGKGTGDRLLQHFEDARREADEVGDVERLQIIRDLVGRGGRPNDIGKIVARLETEILAFDIEALLIKFVYNFSDLANIRMGHRWLNVRARGDWAPHEGFDLPRIVNPDIPQDRTWLRELLISDGMGVALDAVTRSFPALRFDDAAVLDAGGLARECSVPVGTGGAVTRLKVFTYRSKIQIEARPRSRSQRDAMLQHFSALGAESALRKDVVFIPYVWRGARGMTDDVGIATERVGLMLNALSANCLEDLLPGVLELFAPRVAQAGGANGVRPLRGRATNAAIRAAPMPVKPRAGLDEAGDVEDPILSAVRDAFPDIFFGCVSQSSDGVLKMSANVASEGEDVGTHLVINRRPNGAQIELRPLTKCQITWMNNHFAALEARNSLRNDLVFYPLLWKREGVADNEETAIDRVALLLEIVSATNRDDLSQQVIDLLEPRR